jgi:hypothetical protein
VKAAHRRPQTKIRDCRRRHSRESQPLAANQEADDQGREGKHA